MLIDFSEQLFQMHMDNYTSGSAPSHFVKTSLGKLLVVYLDQHLGAAHSKPISISSISMFSQATKDITAYIDGSRSVPVIA